MTITAHLFRGADRPTTLSELAERLGMSRREVEQQVQEARLAGEPIVGGPRGIYLAQTPQEQAEAASSLRERALHQLVTARAMRRSARAWALREAKVEALTLGFEEEAA